jgi:hypothetical protein
LTTSEADTAMLVTAFANAKAAPVWLGPGVYYSCGVSALPDVVRGGVVGGPAAWIGVAAPGAGQINPWPYIPSLIYCNNNAATGPMIHVHDQTTLFGFGIQGNNALGGTPSMTCVSAINTVAHNEHDMQYIGCGVNAFGIGTASTAAVDLSSSSTSGDQGTLSQGWTFHHVACFYCGHFLYGDNANGGNGNADGKIDDLECETNGASCVDFTILTAAQFNLIRAEDDAVGIELGSASAVQITNTLCHGLASGHPCMQVDGFNNSNNAILISTFTNDSAGAPDIQVTEIGSGSVMYLNIINFITGTGTGLKYITTAGASRNVQVDSSVPAYDAASKAVILSNPLGGPMAEWLAFKYAYTLGTGALQIYGCTSAFDGRVYIVSDSNTPTYGSPATGGGSVATPVRCNGATSTWVWN